MVSEPIWLVSSTHLAMGNSTSGSVISSSTPSYHVTNMKSPKPSILILKKGPHKIAQFHTHHVSKHGILYHIDDDEIQHGDGFVLSSCCSCQFLENRWIHADLTVEMWIYTAISGKLPTSS